MQEAHTAVTAPVASSLAHYEGPLRLIVVVIKPLDEVNQLNLAVNIVHHRRLVELTHLHVNSMGLVCRSGGEVVFLRAHTTQHYPEAL